MELKEDLIRASKKYKSLYDLINDNDYHPTPRDFYELKQVREEYDSSYVDSLPTENFEDYIPKGDF